VCKDEDVYIIGGANSAGQAAMFFSKYARRVVMLVRARRSPLPCRNT
jgi:thioredoxin reductase (NADPH)